MLFEAKCGKTLVQSVRELQMMAVIQQFFMTDSFIQWTSQEMQNSSPWQERDIKLDSSLLV